MARMETDGHLLRRVRRGLDIRLPSRLSLYAAGNPRPVPNVSSAHVPPRTPGADRRPDGPCEETDG